MKILSSLPKGSNLQHDGPLLQVVKYAKPAFILISSFTVFLGVYSHLSTWMEEVSLWLAFPIYLFAYALVSLAPDVLNSVAAGYVARSLIKGLYEDKLTKFLMAFCFILVGPLTWYSYNMSTVTAGAAVENGSKETPKANTADIDSSYQLEIARITKEYEAEKISLENQFNRQLEAATLGIVADIQANEKAIEGLENNRKDSNTQWTDQRQNKLRSKIATLQTEKATIELPILQEQKEALAAIKTAKEEKEREAKSLRTDDRKREINLTDDESSKLEKVTASLKAQFSGLAGYSVFIVLLLTAVQQILNHRNNIEYEFRFGLWDAGVNPVAEVIGLPFTMAGRKIINGVRNKYGELSPMQKAVITEVEYNSLPPGEEEEAKND